MLREVRAQRLEWQEWDNPYDDYEIAEEWALSAKRKFWLTPAFPRVPRRSSYSYVHQGNRCGALSGGTRAGDRACKPHLN